MIPQAVRRAAALVALQGAALMLGAVVFVVRGLGGADRRIVDGFGNALWFGLVAAAVLGAAWALWRGRRWGRGIAVFTQMLILPATWYAGVGSHRWVYAVPVAAVSVLILVLLFSPATLRWWSNTQDNTQDPASATSSGPDTR